MKNALLLVGLGALILVAGWWYLSSSDVQSAQNTREESQNPASAAGDTPSAARGEENLVEFKCADGKSITAVFIRDTVGLTLSDGRQSSYDRKFLVPVFDTSQQAVRLSFEARGTKRL